MWWSAVTSVVKGFFDSFLGAIRKRRKDAEQVGHARNEVTAETTKGVLDDSKEARKIDREHDRGQHNHGGM